MGVIQRQSLKHTFISYFGMFLGVFSVLFIYPLAKEEYGLFQVIISATSICLSFFSLGMGSVGIKFFPIFKNYKNGHNGFLSFLLLGGVLGFLIFLISFPLFSNLFSNNFFKEQPLFADYSIYLLPIVFLFLFNHILVNYISNFQRIVIPSILEQLLIKLVLPLLFVLYITNYITLNWLLLGVVLNYILVLVGLILYLKYILHQFHLTLNKPFFTKSRLKEIKSFSIFSIFNSIGANFAFRLDILMVASMVSLTSGGTYAIINVMTDIISKPGKALFSISGPIIANHLKNNEIREVELIYKKSSLALLLFGLLVFFNILLSLFDLLNLMPNTDDMIGGETVLFFLGTAKIFDMMTGVNNQIIIYSKFYKFNFYILFGLAILNVIFNLIFIPFYGIIGAALATLCSVFFYNSIKLAFIYFKFKIHPFKIETLYAILTALMCYFIISLIDFEFCSIANVFFRSILFTGLFMLIAFKFNFSEDINRIISTFFKKIGL